jgi:hypothetical protein
VTTITKAPPTPGGAHAGRRPHAALGVVAGVGRRRHLRRQPGRDQAGHRPGRRLRRGRREAAITNWELVYKHQIHVIGLNIGILIQAARQIFDEVMGEMFGLLAAGVLTPGQPTVYELADGPKALTELEARATIGKLDLLP